MPKVVTKIEVIAHDHDNNGFTCTCFDESLGDNTPERFVSESELATYLHCSFERIPVVTNPGEVDEVHSEITLEAWLADAGVITLENALEDIINSREGRKGKQAVKPVLAAGDFLETKGLKSILHHINHAA